MTTARERADEVVAWFKRERVVGSFALRDRIEAAILAHEAEGWRPISEAKRGDVIIIGWTSGRPVVVEWDDWNILAYAGDLRPTHFRLLPPPPEVKP